MLTPDSAQEAVEWAEENGISIGWLIGPHIAFWVIVIGFCIAICMI